MHCLHRPRCSSLPKRGLARTCPGDLLVNQPHPPRRLQPHAPPGCSPMYPVCTFPMISPHAAATLRTRHARSPAAATMVRSVASCSLPNRSHLGYAARGAACAHRQNTAWAHRQNTACAHRQNTAWAHRQSTAWAHRQSTAWARGVTGCSPAEIRISRYLPCTGGRSRWKLELYPPWPYSLWPYSLRLYSLRLLQS
jgi:hypothetical protein